MAVLYVISIDSLDCPHEVPARDLSMFLFTFAYCNFGMLSKIVLSWESDP